MVFSSTVIHRSGPNLIDRLRRVYLAQYSAEQICSKDGGGPLGDNEQFLSDGQRTHGGFGRAARSVAPTGDPTPTMLD